MTHRPDIFQRIRHGCRYVDSRARHVTIDESALRDYAGRLADELPVSPGCDDAPGECDEDLVAFVLTLDAVNFGSGYFPTLQPVGGHGGYWLIHRRLQRHFERRGPIAPRKLQSFTPADCAQLFGQPLDRPGPGELMGLFARSFSELGAFVCEQFGGEFCDLVAAADHSAARLVGLLAQIPSYRDTADYRGRTVPFYKRAQITAADLHLFLGADGFGQFEDIDRLTVFADNQVPHVLRTDGVLRYSTRLAERIDAGRLLEPGSPEEVEIRACTVHAVEQLVAELQRRGVEANPLDVDQLLWHRGERPDYRRTPAHLTRTTAY